MATEKRGWEGGGEIYTHSPKSLQNSPTSHFVHTHTFTVREKFTNAVCLSFSVSLSLSHTHTQTHTVRERDREREKEKYNRIESITPPKRGDSPAQ